MDKQQQATEITQDKRLWIATFTTRYMHPASISHSVYPFKSKAWLLWHFANLPHWRLTEYTNERIMYTTDSGNSTAVCLPYILPNEDAPVQLYNQHKEAI